MGRCDGNLPACAACSSVYNTECLYDLNSDHRRKGVYKKASCPIGVYKLRAPDGYAIEEADSYLIGH